MAKFIIGGQSHAYAFGLPSAPTDSASEVVRISDDLEGVIGGWPRPDDYWEHLARAGEGKVVLLSWYGSDPVSRYIFQGNPPFDFVLSSGPDLAIQPGHRVIPETLIRHSFSRHAEPLRVVLRQLSLKSAKVVLLCPPPPKGVSAEALNLMKKERLFNERLASAPEFPPVIQAEVLRKLWLLLRDMQISATLRTGTSFADFPKTAIGSDGFLKSEYWKQDFTHANRACGDLFFAEIKHAF